MASGKRQPSKQKRAAQNRAQRDALAARREAAAPSRPTRGTERGSAGSGSAGRGGLMGRLRAGPARAGGVRQTMAAGRAAQPVGYRAGLSALLMSLAGMVFCFTFSVPVDADGDTYTRASLTATWAGSALGAAAADPAAEPAGLAGSIDDWAPGRNDTPIALALWPFSLTLALPVIGSAIGFRAISQRSSSRIVGRALFATLFGSLLSQIPIFFLPSVVALGIAVFQLRRYEATVAAAGAAAAHGEGVIDAEVVEDAEAGVDIDDDPPAEEHEAR